MLWAIFGALLMGCSDEEIANVETSSRNAIGFNVLSNAAETRATSIYFLMCRGAFCVPFSWRISFVECLPCIFPIRCYSRELFLSK